MTAQESRRDYEKRKKELQGRKTKRKEAVECTLLGNRRGHQKEGEGPANENRRREKGRVFWSRRSAVPSLAQTLTQMCPSNSRPRHSLGRISSRAKQGHRGGWRGGGERKPSAEGSA